MVMQIGPGPSAADRPYRVRTTVAWTAAGGSQPADVRRTTASLPAVTENLKKALLPPRKVTDCGTSSGRTRTAPSSGYGCAAVGRAGKAERKFQLGCVYMASIPGVSSSVHTDRDSEM